MANPDLKTKPDPCPDPTTRRMTRKKKKRRLRSC
jgi:hypothetical protein